eukprot:1345728-Amorphochlora_amoeboformis.AAC.1
MHRHSRHYIPYSATSTTLTQLHYTTSSSLQPPQKTLVRISHTQLRILAHQQVLDVCAYLIGVDSKALETALTTNLITAGRQKIRKNNNKLQAEFARDTLAKAIYSKLFDWIVKRINVSIENPGFKGIQIGVLDIYGSVCWDVT